MVGCYPVVQPQGHEVYPAVVYGGTGHLTGDGLSRERFPSPACTPRRREGVGTTTPSWALGRSIRASIRETAARLRQSLGEIDDYDTTLKVWRHILTLSVRF